MKMQKKQQHQQYNLKKIVTIMLVLIACSIFIGVAATNSAAQEAASAESTAPAPALSDKQTADNNILELTNKFKTLTVAYNDKPGVNYKTLIENSIDANIAARALLDQATGFIKIAEFKKDYQITPSKAVYPAITPADEKAGIRIMKFDARIEDKKLLLDSEFQILKPSENNKDYSINYAIKNKLNKYIFAFEQSEQIRTKEETGPMRVSKSTVLFDNLILKSFDTDSGIDSVDLYVYDALKIPGDIPPIQKEVLMQNKSLTEEAQEIKYGGNTKFTADFVNPNRVLLLTTDIDKNDRDDFYYQYEFTTKSGTSKLYPVNRALKDEMIKNKQSTIPYSYLNINKDTDIKSIKLNVYSYSTNEKTVYFKEEDFTTKSPPSGPECTKCNDDSTCTIEECNGINKDSCIWIPDTGISMSRFKEVLASGATKVGLSALSDWQLESGFCNDKKGISKEDECASRCKSRSCDTEDKKKACIVDKNCIPDGDKCIVNQDYGVVPTLTKQIASFDLYYKPIIDTTLKEAGITNKRLIDRALIYALIIQESTNDANAVSSKGAIGLMQIMDATAWQYNKEAAKAHNVELISNIFTKIGTCGKCKETNSCTKSTCDVLFTIPTAPEYDDRFDADKSIKASIYILDQKMNTFKGYTAQKELGIASYNAGQGAVQKAVNSLASAESPNPETLTWEQLKNKGLTTGVKYANEVLKRYEDIEVILNPQIGTA